jgi:hypothetical protein
MNNPRIPGRPGLSRGAPQPPPGRPGRPGQPGRPFKPQPAQMNPLPIILGVVGVLLVVILFVVMSSGGGEKPAPKETASPPPPPAAPKPVDVSGLERDGYKACDEGLAIIRSLESRIAADTSTLSDAEQQKLKTELKKGMDLLKKGMEYLGDANEKSGRTYDLNKYIQAKKLATNKWHGLKGD